MVETEWGKAFWCTNTEMGDPHWNDLWFSMQQFLFLHLIGIDRLVLPYITTRCQSKTKVKLLLLLCFFGPLSCKRSGLWTSKKELIHFKGEGEFKKWIAIILNINFILHFLLPFGEHCITLRKVKLTPNKYLFRVNILHLFWFEKVLTEK